MKKSKNVLLLFLCGVFFFLCALGSTSTSTENYKRDAQENANTKITEVSFAEEKVYEGNNVVIYVTGSESTYNGTEINFRIENNSQLNLGFYAHSYGVNGIMTGNNIYDMDTDVPAGKKANNSLTIENSFLNEYSIDCIKYVEILFWAYDNDKMFKSFDTGVVIVKSDNYDNINSWIKGTEIYNAEGIRVDFLSLKNDKAKYLVTNTKGNSIDVTFEGICINDYSVNDTDYDLFDEQILNNNQRVFEISISNDFKSKNSIQDVKTIEFYLSYTIGSDYTSHKTSAMKTTIG